MAVAVLLGGAALAAAWTTRPLPTPSSYEAALPARAPVEVVEGLPQLTARLQAEADAGRFMGAVLVARGDEVLFRQAYGTADVATGAPNQITSRFRLASVSKQFTAAAILKLQDEGKLSIGDPVCQWIQPCPAAWAPIRLSHLLSHTSGIPDLMARPGWGNRRVTPATIDELTDDSGSFGLSFVPGSKLAYNNAGFNLAAAVVEKASGMTFAAYLRSAFFEPLGMADTGFDDDTDLGIVTGHATFPEGLTAQRQPNVSIVAGAGALYSTLDDMLVWEQALHGGHVLKPFSYAQMIADHAPTDEPRQRNGLRRRDWGYGLMANRLGQRVTPAFQDWEIYHTGSWSGFRNLVTWQPDARIAVIVLSNNYHQQPQVLLISQQGMAEALGHPFPTGLAD
ncbi:serine hydrolase domain-containing protein [Brevundimonas subvibrioides]|uniref:Beta-lactamase n=1 Tax=Brevundimonas subvibrioides (strain ATCC 15264 / DSM 4735 / LMG 14903 / NBRC 16000 / CB 81) TaxID=633149 RepID=D9QI23_BRESC|nr:serine hydrolase domain-containing protein [Brevundimonas subvibrioides]ADL01281.1 beta-lactamase [Brevundimonas subvibrioides ATCC 15264]